MGSLSFYHVGFGDWDQIQVTGLAAGSFTCRAILLNLPKGNHVEGGASSETQWGAWTGFAQGPACTQSCFNQKTVLCQPWLAAPH